MKNWVRFLLCVVFAASIWLVLNLSQNYVAIVSVPVIARSNIEGRAAVSQSEATASAQVTTTGFRHILLGRSHKRTKQVTFAATDFRRVGGVLRQSQHRFRGRRCQQYFRRYHRRQLLRSVALCRQR